ncbi:DASH complex subunit Duo1-domain-containing protein [Piptocephalis cylindrospora]|uniref:DASH complex subunit DUO1 n=1 Tax=Piptocephalis cylindrospora TaxID=1907219 RepID=A0A4P9Y673_9FUNG|nr:DASH complex subunit Duo1-domain-containing protein [Piptocephalis cylindrospora]|eukprot:RKP14568.1 DASH complex subunit Duo1-domain-containing protein [Piptocephalis cylindrospora]
MTFEPENDLMEQDPNEAKDRSMRGGEDPTTTETINEEREEKDLENELEDIRQLDAAIVGMTENVLVCKEHLEKVSNTAKQTDVLLERWSALFSQMQHTQALLLDDRWQGAKQDEVDEAREQAEVAAATRVREAVMAKEAGRIKEAGKIKEAGRVKEAGRTGEALASRSAVVQGKRKRPDVPSPPTMEKPKDPSSKTGGTSKIPAIRSLRPPSIQVRQTMGLNARKKR